MYDVYVDVKWVRSDLRLQYNLKIKMCMRKTPRCSNELIANTYNVFMVHIIYCSTVFEFDFHNI